MKTSELIELVYELAFGDGAIDRGYSYQEVADQLKMQSQISNTCEACGCIEFLCGHNARRFYESI